jgi:hypothetical protein
MGGGGYAQAQAQGAHYSSGGGGIFPKKNWTRARENMSKEFSHSCFCEKKGRVVGIQTQINY